MMKITGIVLGALLLSACGGGSGGGSNENSPSQVQPPVSTEGSISLGVTDGPIDSAEEVVVQFNAVVLKPAGGEEINFEFDEPKTIDLLSLQGQSSESLLTNESIPAGEYNWIRLDVSAEEDGKFDSYIMLEDGTHELDIPSGSNSGLKLVSGFTVAVGSVSNFVIDFDLRKSITAPPGQSAVKLKPALRLINNLEVGSLSGSIDSNLLGQACENVTENDGAVYLYNGLVNTVRDLHGSENDPVTTALVADDWTYEIGFISEGTYTAAYTCENTSDEPEVEDEIMFYGQHTVEININSNTELNFEYEGEPDLDASTEEVDP